MHCLMCESFSLKHICPSCQTTFLTPSIYKRQLANGTTVISFYKYTDIQALLFTKHTDIGYHIFKILAKLSFKKFADEFHTKEKFTAICIDDTIKSGYSHTAILNKSLSTYNISPKFNKLRAKSTLSYSGKSKSFRELHPRNFELKHFKERSIILVDDIITTGSTLTQAIDILSLHQKTVLFCLTLTDVSLK